MAQDGGDRQGGAGVSDPYAIDDLEGFDALGQCVADEDGYLGLGGALVVAQLGEPAVAPVLGALEFPQHRAAGLTALANDPVQHVAAKFTLGHGFDGVEGELGAQQVFQFQFLHFALQLLRALLGLLFEFLDLLLHGGDGLVLLHHFEFQSFLRFAFGLAADFGQAVLHALFDGQFEFAPGVVEFALFLDQFGLRLLGFGQLFVARLEHFLKFGEFARLAFEFRCRGLLRFLRFFGDDAGALGL
ncbi:hypothetical protein GALL_484720 [mine drainage metagenome]|uniref:NAD-specific glutamate dehydrogenase n=1 Tax=mine drainage metagenome TaxID=410659 RepID=A0A1J5PGL3_9ZZZZ